MIYSIAISFLIALSTLALGAKNSAPLTHLRHRETDPFSTGLMQEDGFKSAAAPECKGQLGWVYRNGFCYMFSSYHETFLKAEEECNKVGGYLADVLDEDENNWIKSVLNVINPKDGTDYWLGGLDADRDGDMYWMTGNPMTFHNFIKDQPDGNPYAHMDFDQGFAWNAKDDANDKDNGFVCKRPLHIFAINGDVSLIKGNHVWSTSDWSDEFKVEYDVIVNKELSGTWASLFHVYRWSQSRIPSVIVGEYFLISYRVNGTEYNTEYNYELNKDYHFEISQQRNSNGEAVYSIKVNGETFYEIVITTPVKYKNVQLYLSDPWHDTFEPFGKLSNLKVNADLTQ